MVIERTRGREVESDGSASAGVVISTDDEMEDCRLCGSWNEEASRYGALAE